jgi:phosphoenolpyruvate---glycerone phosphotransferase subunit DhaL
MTEFADLVQAVTLDVIAARDELNRLDGAAGDGDLGITLATGAEAILAILPEIDPLAFGVRLRRIGLELARRVPSTGGTLIATGFLAASKAEAAEEGSRLSHTERAARLLEAAQAGIAQRGRAVPGEKTMLDALDPATRAMREAADARLPIGDGLAAAAAAAARGAEATVAMGPKHGRAAWLAERSAGHEDAGARAIALFFESLARAAAVL